VRARAPASRRWQVISADDALKEFRQYSGFGTALQALRSNPLPNVLHVRPAGNASAPGDLESLKHYLSAWPEVDLCRSMPSGYCDSTRSWSCCGGFLALHGAAGRRGPGRHR